MPTNDEMLARYLRRRAPVVGWLGPQSARVIAALGGIQRQNDLAGCVGEIGVHHGRLFIVLLLTRWGDQGAFAIDVFDEQHLNIDRSGRGNQEAFLQNVAHWCGSAPNVTLIRKSSTQVEPSEILSTVGKCRLMSIDGGHTAECCVNDLHLAESVLRDFGIAIVDDVFNQIWPGVATGVASYCGSVSTSLRPFAISPNKVYFAHPDIHLFYRNELRKAASALYHKSSVMYGCEVDIYGTKPLRPLRARIVPWLRHQLSRRSLATLVRRLIPAQGRDSA